MFFTRTSAWNGIGNMAIEPLLILSELTQIHDLKFLTLLTWSSVLASRCLLRKKKAWCPICYEDWEQNGIEIHEPLLWSIGCGSFGSTLYFGRIKMISWSE
ncbi:hypothetical protein CK510_12250 [Brunnivagina elsteri CCALA 953]|uniref:Uncharacterized protein n=1 Tax=Brunnivagina elsteri CCALA 953 TaxID=987040 RepID=A0A2A2TJ49_9CYAN|nr:hypothetical protein CK510_12250 [Calothrix elsteri CCALA 953]